jgi:hypothetical protein
MRRLSCLLEQIYRNSIKMSDTNESFDIEEYAKQAKYIKSRNARILNNDFRVSLSNVLKHID